MYCTSLGLHWPGAVRTPRDPRPSWSAPTSRPVAPGSRAVRADDLRMPVGTRSAAPDSWRLVCRGWGAQGGEDVVGGVGQTWCGCEVVAVEVDGDVLQAA